MNRNPLKVDISMQPLCMSCQPLHWFIWWHKQILETRSFGALLLAPTSSWQPVRLAWLHPLRPLGTQTVWKQKNRLRESSSSSSQQISAPLSQQSLTGDDHPAMRRSKFLWQGEDGVKWSGLESIVHRRNIICSLVEIMVSLDNSLCNSL